MRLSFPPNQPTISEANETRESGNDLAHDRNAAWELVCRYVQNPALRRHMLAVETVMRAYAATFGEDAARWGITGLLHDFDWEIHPNATEHPEFGCRMLEERGYSADIVRAIRGHATYLNVPRDSRLAQALFACDELTGFVTAVVQVRPNKSIAEVSVDSVKKKLKEKRFAANVSRAEIEQAAREFHVDLDAHIEFIIDALRGNAAPLQM